MAFLLYKYIRGKLREREAAKTAAGGHLVPEADPVQHKPEQRIDRNITDDAPGAIISTPERTYTDAEVVQIKREKSARRKYRWKIILGLILPNFLAAVDVTIVAPAIPIISSHFNRLSGSFNWIVAANTLTLTTFVPSSGQLADIYGRHAALQFHIFFIMIGSVFCAAAATWGMLLFGRALQGLGGAGIWNLTRIILSDNVSLAENSRNNSLFSLITGVSYAVGPVIGGYLASAGWRYVFVVPVGVAFVAHFLIFFLMRNDLVKGRASTHPEEQPSSSNLGMISTYISGLASLDWIGMFLFIFGIGLVILAVMWGGTQYKWSSAAVVAPFVLGGVLTAAFFMWEYLLGPERFANRIFPKTVAMIPSILFSKLDTWLLMVIDFSAGISLVSAFYFISIYWELAQGYSSSDAGIQLLYYTPGLGVGVYTAMFLCNVWPRQTFSPLFWGSLIETVGLSLITWAVTTDRKALVNGMLALAGVGTGLRFMPVALHAAGTWRTRIPAMQSLIQFMIPFGETIGISMMGAVFTNKFNAGLRSIDSSAGQQEFSANGPPNLNMLEGLPPQIKAAVQDSASKAVMWSFVSILPFMALSLIASLLLGNVWIGKPEKKDKKGKVTRKVVRGKVMYRSYLLSIVTGNRKNWEKELDELPQGGNRFDRLEKLENREKLGDLESGGAMDRTTNAEV